MKTSYWKVALLVVVLALSIGAQAAAAANSSPIQDHGTPGLDLAQAPGSDTHTKIEIPALTTVPIYWGAIVKGVTYGLPDPPADMRAVYQFEQNAGKKISILHFGNSWFSNGIPNNFPTSLMENIRLHGTIPYYSWSSRDTAAGGASQPNYQNADIINGTYDSYIRQWATAAKNWGHPFFLRFDWEMNGWWYPWAEGSLGTTGVIVNGNKPGEYAAMWKHVHDIFTQVGATNVTWVWCINQMSDTSSGKHPPMSQIYPGDNYVDWTGFDNYNRYPGWLSFNTMITGAGTDWLLNTYQATLAVAPGKPIMLGEWGSKEDSSDPQRKANWFTDAILTQIPNNFPAIKAVVYFDWNISNDPSSPDASLAIETSPQSQAAFAGAIASAYYSTNIFTNLPSGRIQPLTSSPAPIQTSSPTPKPTPTLSPTPQPTQPANLLANASFESTGTTWLSPWVLSVTTGAGGAITQDKSSFQDGSASAKLTTTQTGGQWYYVSLAQKRLTFSANKTYTISFWAKASAARVTHVIVQQNYSPYTEYTKKTMNIGTGWQKYTFSFTCPVSDSNLKFSFSAADSTGTLWVDAVTIMPTN